MADREIAPAARWKTTFLVSAGVFLALALAARFWGVLPAERELYQWIIRGASPGVIAVFWWVNQLGNKWVLAPAALLFLLLVRPARRRWWLWVAVLVFPPILEDIGKTVVGRLRPEGIAFGFPSGHVTAAAAFFSTAAHLGGRALRGRAARIALWVGAAVIVLLVAIARIVLRAHWPADVVGGASLALACVALAVWRDKRTG